MSLVPNRPHVVDEVFGDETVVVHLETGCYYSLDAAATQVWALLEQGAEVDQVAALTGLAAQDVTAFVDSLVAEQLLVPGTGTGTPELAPVAVHGTPGFERFTDMQDLLLIDPVHDIALDGDGWPVAQ